MKTSYFAITKPDVPGAISISRSLPRWGQWPRYEPLAPGDWFKSVPMEEYIPRYHALLAKLDPQQVWTDLILLAKTHAITIGLEPEAAAGVEPILLCYENAQKFCHRRLAANWLESELGVAVDECRYNRQTGDRLVVPGWEQSLNPEPQGQMEMRL